MTGKELEKLARKYKITCARGCGRIVTRIFPQDRYTNEHLVDLTCGFCFRSKYGESPVTFQTAIDAEYYSVSPEVLEANLEWWAQFQNSPAKEDHHYRISYDDILGVLEQ